MNHDEEEPTEEQIQSIDPHWQRCQHAARVAFEQDRIRAKGLVPTLRDGFDTRFDGPWA